MKGLLLALKPGKGEPPKSERMEGAEPDSEPDVGDDYKQIAKDAAKDGDWNAMVDALCAYMRSEK